MGRKIDDEHRSSKDVVPSAKMVMDTCELFPNDEHDDLVDTCVQAWAFLGDSGYIISETALPPADGEDVPQKRAFYG